MPDVSGPFDGTSTLQAQWYRHRGYTDPSGVYGTVAANPAAGDLGLTASGFDLSLGLGRASVRGAYYERTGTAWTTTVPANTSTAGPRRDLIVLRRDLAAKTVTPVRLQGNPAASPTDPALTRVEDGVWDLPLFRVQAPANSGTPLTITDLREMIDPGSGQLAAPAVRLRRSGLQTIAHNAWTPIQWNVVDANVGSTWPHATGTAAADIPIRRAGWYMMTVQAAWGGGAACRIGVRIMRNGAPDGTGALVPVTNLVEPSVGTSVLVAYGAGDVARVDAFQDSGGNRDLVSVDYASTHVSLTWTRPL